MIVIHDAFMGSKNVRGGADGNRTRVRTGKQYAFYMLIFA